MNQKSYRFFLQRTVLALFGFLGIQQTVIASITRSDSNAEAVLGSSITRTVYFPTTAGSQVGAVEEVTISFQKTYLDNNTFLSWPWVSYYNEIGFALTAPDGTTVTLVQENSVPNNVGVADGSWLNGGYFSTFDGTITFTPGATLKPGDGARVPQTTTPYAPQSGSLDDFVGSPISGSPDSGWTLTITDTSNQYDNPTRYASFSLTLHALPEPRSATLWGLVLLVGGMLVFGRQKRMLPNA